MSEPARVLIVEDHPDNREVFSQILQHSGFVVEVARDGDEALERVREGRPDIVLMDLSMPRLDGLETTRILKGDGCSDVPILAVTARSVRRGELEPLGFSGLLRKPVPMTMLLAAVRAALRQGKAWAHGT